MVSQIDPMTDQRTYTVSIYLLKASINDDSEALRDEAATGLRTHEVALAETVGRLYVQVREGYAPDWARMLGPVADPPLDAYGRSFSAILFLEASGRRFAIAFGNGRHLIDPRAYERDFGLHASRNAVNPTKLRGAEARTFTESALHTLRQMSRLAAIESLELDVQRDLVTSLSGALEDTSFGVRIGGRDAVRLTSVMAAPDLPDKCARLLEFSQLTTYRRHFDWLDNIERVSDPVTIERLDERAYDALRRGSFSRFDVFPPEIVPAEVVLFALRPGGITVVEPDERFLHHAAPAPGTMTTEQTAGAIRRHRVEGLDPERKPVEKWDLWDCLHFEDTDADGTWVLDGGRWFRIERDFAKGVASFAAGLGPSPLQLPVAGFGEYEEAYNTRAAADPSLALLDRDTIQLTGMTAIEPCDLFSDQRLLVHVKRRKGGSAPLSHLFGQALVSAEMLISIPAFRDALEAKLEASQAGFGQYVAAPIQAADFGVVLAMITGHGAGPRPAEDLPFFAKVHLRTHVSKPQAMGFKVYVDKIMSAAPQVGMKPGPPRRRPRRPAAAPTPVPGP